MNSQAIKTIFKKLFSEETKTIIGNLSYLAILALAPTIIITTSILDILANYFSFQTIHNFNKIYSLSRQLNLTQSTSFIINILCINFLSDGIFSLLSSLEKIYHFRFENYVRKKLYSLALSLILLLTIISIITLSFFLTKHTFLKDIDFIVTLITIFCSVLIFYKFSTFQKFKNLYPGALMSSLALTIFLNFFYYIIRNFSNIRIYYGLLTPITITILLIFYSCHILYFGILLNVYFSKKANNF